MTSPRPFAEVIGDPIDHSKSPVIHSFWLEQIGIEADYRATRVERGSLAAWLVDRRSNPAWLGCNVTMPLKLDALTAADTASDRALAAGAANLLVHRDGVLGAGNTDVGGAARLIEPLLGRGIGKGITLLGTGGAARAMLVALRLLDVEEVCIQARDLAEATRLAVEFGHSIGPHSFDSAIDSTGLINATPLGMTGMPPLGLDVSAMPAGGWVFDLVTDPAPTSLLRAARESGLATIDGLQMLVEQAADSFSLLFGKEAPRDKDAELFERLKP